MENKKVEKVITGKVKTKKKGGLRKLSDIFKPEDTANVKSYILFDVIVPTLKKFIDDIVSDGIHMLLYGESGDIKKKSSYSSKISYGRYYEEREKPSYNRLKPQYELDDIILDSRGEAEEVLRQLDELIEMYDMVSVADLYDLLGISCNYTDNNYGWENIRNAKIIRVRDGYLLNLPKVISLKK